MAVTLKAVSKISGSFGQDGEEKVAELLEKELPDHFLILNSPRIAYRDEIVDIDHIVISPTGIYVIECKNMNGRISGGLMGNWMQEKVTNGRREMVKIGNPASQVNHYTKVVRDYLRSQYLATYDQQKNFKFEPIVVFSHEHSNISRMTYTSKGRIGKVRVCLLKDLIPYIIEHEKQYLSVEEMDQCADLLVPQDQRDKTGVFDVLADLSYKEKFHTRYQLLEELGRGSFGNVFKAFDNKLDREVAVKRMDPRYNKTEDIDRFTREAKITAKLSHENIVTFYDYYEEEEGFFLVMELVEGLTLGDLLDAGVFSLHEVKNIFSALCGAVAYAHENGVIHRDLKAANILITENHIPKITDFGVARLTDEANQTQSRVSIGTPNNMAPEQVMGEAVDERTDIFALGVLLYQMLTGSLPFQGDCLGEVVHKVLKDQPLPPSRVLQGLDPALDKIVLKALEKDPKRRFQTAVELQQAFITAFEVLEGQGFEQTGGILESLLRAGSGWEFFWKSERNRFYLFFLGTALVMLWLVSLQFFLESRLDDSPKTALAPGQQKALLELNKENYRLVTNNNLADAMENVESYQGAEVNLSAQLLSIEGQSEAGYLFKVQVNLLDEPSSKEIFVAYKGDPHLMFADGKVFRDIKIVGIFDKLLANNDSSLPLILAARIERIEPWSVLAPTLFEIPVNQKVVHNNKQITLTRIEFAESETRLYLNVKNTSLSKQLVIIANPQGQQHGTTIKRLYEATKNYSFELESGQSTDGLIVLARSNPFIGELEVQLDEGSFITTPYKFLVKWQVNQNQ